MSIFYVKYKIFYGETKGKIMSVHRYHVVKETLLTKEIFQVYIKETCLGTI